MPRIFDNIAAHYSPSLRSLLGFSRPADLCVGYSDLREWRELNPQAEPWPEGDGQQCRLVEGMPTRFICPLGLKAPKT
jgi:hypothetical protein